MFLLVKDIIKDMSVDWVLKHLPPLHLTPWLLRDMFFAKVLFPSLSGSSWGDSDIDDKGLLAVLERMLRFCALEGKPNSILPLN